MQTALEGVLERSVRAPDLCSCIWQEKIGSVFVIASEMFSKLLVPRPKTNPEMGMPPEALFQLSGSSSPARFV